jgi:hypothetical protein
LSIYEAQPGLEITLRGTLRFPEEREPQRVAGPRVCRRLVEGDQRNRVAGWRVEDALGLECL